MRLLMPLIVIVVMQQAVPLVEGGEKRISGKITAVDAANRTITVGITTVDVIRKSVITVEGEAARFANVAVGQSAIVNYDDEFEYASTIAVRESLANDEEKTAADLKFLQGNWVGIAEEEANGELLDVDTVRERDRRVTVSRNNFVMTRTLDGKRASFNGKFEIDAATGHFDFIGKGVNGQLSEWIGIYEIKGDTWRLRYNFKTADHAARPTRFEIGEGEESRSRMYTFKRDRGDLE